MLERSDDNPKGEVLLSRLEKPHKSGGVSFLNQCNTLIAWIVLI